ncbi:GON-4-like protein isoform X3 [Salvelinus sp. IW2-2015]|uniref:GON-4-like protein isoform X3 n=1 Tax=Salvelinus sp. IW2-2015 TaxID=2691554 RepID=UPI0038D4DC08
MYDYSMALEDCDWSKWLQGLMTSDMENDEEGDDDDDPEYNFLEDLDEPDREDYRNDRAVRITKKEVNKLLEELFETDDELIVNGQDDDGHEEDEEREEAAPPLSALQFNVPQAIRFQEPLANMLTEAAYCEGGNGGSAAEESPPGSLAVPPPSSRYHPPWCCCHLCPAPSSRSTTPRNSSCGSNSNSTYRPCTTRPTPPSNTWRSSRRLPSDQVSPGPRLQQHLEGL